MIALRKVKEEDRYKHWNEPPREPNDEEKLTMIIEAIHVCLMFILTHQYYTFDNKVRKQERGGPIGLDITGTVAQIFMIWWEGEFMSRLASLDIILQMLKRYVDDINLASNALPPGTYYSNGSLAQDNAGDDMMADARTMLILQSVGNDIHPSIQVEVDYPSRYVDRKMPILDLKVWPEDTETGVKIMHEHYMIVVSSKSIVHAVSALPWSVKRTVLTQEGLRIFLNCSRDLPWEIKAHHLTQLTARMQYAGYDKKFRYEVIASAINAYNVLRSAEDNGERPLYRTREWNAEERRTQKRQKKLNWFKKGGYMAPIFVPVTPKGELKQRLQKRVDESGFAIKIVERAGTPIKRKLQRSDPFRDPNCQRPDCFVCQSGGSGSCNSESVTYDIICKECNCPCYRGETAVNAYSRGKEHLQDLSNKRSISVMMRHSTEKHGGQVPEFKMSVTGTYSNDAMLRQISEAVRIRTTSINQLVNSKDEWNYLHLPSVTMETQ